MSLPWFSAFFQTQSDLTSLTYQLHKDGAFKTRPEGKRWLQELLSIAAALQQVLHPGARRGTLSLSEVRESCPSLSEMAKGLQPALQQRAQSQERRMWSGFGCNTYEKEARSAHYACDRTKSKSLSKSEEAASLPATSPNGLGQPTEEPPLSGAELLQYPEKDRPTPPLPPSLSSPVPPENWTKCSSASTTVPCALRRELQGEGWRRVMGTAVQSSPKKGAPSPRVTGKVTATGQRFKGRAGL